MAPVQVTINFHVPLCRRGSDYPRDVLDGLNLSIKESAQEHDTDFLIEVFYYIS